MERFLDWLANTKFGQIDIPITDEEWENFPKTKKGKFILLAIQCVLAAVTSLITMWLISTQ